MNSLRGMPASRTEMTMISFSSWRTSLMCARSWPISASNMRGESLSSMNSAASLLAQLQRLGILGAELLDASASDWCCSLASDAKRRAASSGSGPVSTASSSSPSSPSSVSSVSSASSTSFHLRRVLRLRDHVGRVRVDEADDHVDEAALAGLDVARSAQHQLLDGGRIAAPARGARHRGLPRCAWRC